MARALQEEEAARAPGAVNPAQELVCPTQTHAHSSPCRGAASPRLVQGWREPEGPRRERRLGAWVPFVRVAPGLVQMSCDGSPRLPAPPHLPRGPWRAEVCGDCGRLKGCGPAGRDGLEVRLLRARGAGRGVRGEAGVRSDSRVRGLTPQNPPRLLQAPDAWVPISPSRF